jgi:YD repeat-containing protein
MHHASRSVIASLALFVAMSTAAAEDGSPDWTLIKDVVNCNNKRECTWHKCGETDVTITIDKQYACKDHPPQTGSSGSSISNLNGRYRHDAWDFRIQSPTGKGCSSCGGGSASDGDAVLPSLEIHRFYASDNSYPTSFGRHWGWNGDIWLTLYAPGQVPSWIPAQGVGWVAETSQPHEDPIDAVLITDPDGDGVFTTPERAHAKDLRFYTATGGAVVDPSLAAMAILTQFNGDRVAFELYPGSAIGAAHTGRVIWTADRNDQRMTWRWKYRVDDPTLTGSLATKLAILDRVTDAYGRTAVFTYDETRQHAGVWVVTSILLPDGRSVFYDYGSILDPHGEVSDQLIAVRHPDGSRSAFSATQDPVTANIEWTCNDPAAEPESRVKTVQFTNIVWRNPADPTDIRIQTWGRARQVRNGAGELTYSNWIADYTTAAGTVATHSYVFDHGRTWGIEHQDGDFPSAIFYRDEVASAPDTWFKADWIGWTPIDRYEYLGPRGSLSRHIDPLGHATSWTRDAVSTAPTVITYPDGTRTTITYNAFTQPLRIVDRLGRITDATYDARGNRLTLSRAVGTIDAATWRWTYDARGLVTTSTDANGKITTYAYAAAGFLASITSPIDRTGDLPAITRFGTDAVGRRTSSTDASGRVVTYAYDARNRLVDFGYPDASHELTIYGAPTGPDANLVIATTDRNGNRTDYRYDAAGRRTTTIEAAGSAVAFASSVTYRSGTSQPLTEIVSGDATDFRYDARMRLVSTSRHTRGALALTERVAYDADSQPAVTTDAYGRRTFLVRDVNDRVIRTVREMIPNGVPVGAVPATLARILSGNPAYIIEETRSDAEGQVTARIDGRGITTAYAYDAQGRQVRVTEAIGTAVQGVTAMTYDRQGNRLSVRSPRQVLDATLGAMVMTYTGRNLVATLTEASGTVDAATTTYLYSPTGKPARVTDALGRVTAYAYGACCDRLVAVTDPAGFIARATFDAYGNRTSQTDANGLTSTFRYDGRHRLTANTDAAGGITSYAYDDSLVDGLGQDAKAIGLGFAAGADGSAVAVTDPMGGTRIEIRDGLGRVARRVDALAHATSVSHDAIVSGLVETVVTDPLLHITRSRIDGQGAVRQVIDAELRSSLATFDANGNRLTVRDPNNVGLTFIYDARNRQVSCTDTQNDPTTTGYDADGNVVAVTDSLGATTRHAHDARGRRISTADRVGGITRFTFDRMGNLLAIVDAQGGTTKYAYDVRDLLVSETFPPPSGGTRAYTYDAGQRLSTRRDQTGAVTTYRYDGADRMTQRIYPDGRNDVFGYDRASRVVSAASGRYGNQVTRAYDADGLLTSETQVIAGVSSRVSYLNDADHRRTRITYPDGRIATRSFSARDQLIGVTFAGATVATRAYDLAGRLASTTFGNGVVETRSYRLDNLVARINAAKGTVGITDLRYSYNRDKSKLIETDALRSAESQTFAYDPEQRLTGWSRGADTQSWALSLVGDWTSTTRAGVTEARTHTPVHEIASLTRAGVTIPLIYDAKGNLTRSEDGAIYRWDVENLLSSAGVRDDAEGTTDTATYAYDAFGRRVQKTVWGVTTTYLHDGAQVIHEFDAPEKLSAAASAPDGTFDSAAVPPGGAIIPGSGALLRVNFQPATRSIPAGFVADKGRISGLRTGGSIYGWNAVNSTGTARNEHPFPQFDTFTRMQPVATSPALTWSINLPNGTYPVVVVMGDCASLSQTNNVIIEGQAQTDPDPYDPAAPVGYERGDFDGYAVNAIVSDGTLTIAAGAGAKDPKLCFIEIGKAGSALSPAITEALTRAVQTATTRTGGKAFPAREPTPRVTVWGAYVDEPLMVVRGAGQKIYHHANHLYSVAAVTDAGGAVLERYRYDAYGKRTVLASNGTIELDASSVGNQRSFTGLYEDSETGLLQAYSRPLSSGLGRWIGRDQWLRNPFAPTAGDGYPDGFNPYAAYQVPNAVDWTGNQLCESIIYFGHLGDVWDWWKKEKQKAKDKEKEREKNKDKGQADKDKDKAPCSLTYGAISCWPYGSNGQINDDRKDPQEIKKGPDAGQGIPGWNTPSNPAQKYLTEESMLPYLKLYDAYKDSMADAISKVCSKECCTDWEIHVECSPSIRDALIQRLGGNLGTMQYMQWCGQNGKRTYKGKCKNGKAEVDAQTAGVLKGLGGKKQ